MRKYLLTFLLLTVVISFASARPRSLKEKLQVAQQQLNKNSSLCAKAAGGGKQSAELLCEYSDLSIVGYTDGGFVVVTNDDMFTPIVGYSDASFSRTDNPNFQWWLENMNQTLAQLAASGEELVTITPSPLYSQKVDALVKTSWGQDSPYNAQCPMYTDETTGQKVSFVTGCIATAMAQIMNYHQYPTKGKGSKSYFFSYGTDSRIRASANFGNTTYEWDKMIDAYTTTAMGKANYTEEQAQAVSTIMYHAGVSVQMGYTPSGSGAYSSDACLALRQYFCYDPNIKMYSRYVYPVDEWMNIIFKELNDNCPVLYTGVSSSQGGHAFVVDGYDENGLVHVNWGWNGSQDGNYNVSSMKGFSQQQDIVIMRKPDDTRFDSKYFSIWGMLSNLSITQYGYNLNVSSDGIYNFDVENFTGAYGVLAMNLSTGEITPLYQSQVSDIEYGYGSRFSVNSLDASALSEGEYRIYLGTKSENEPSWQPVRCSENYNNSYILTRTATSMSISAENNPNWTTTAIKSIAVDMNEKPSHTWYSINGQRLNAEPTQRGIYIHNGKKVVK